MRAGSQTYMHKRQTTLNELIIYMHYTYIHIYVPIYILYVHFINIYIIYVFVYVCEYIYTILRIIKRQDYEFIR